jgi:hypothetical protein
MDLRGTKKYRVHFSISSQSPLPVSHKILVTSYLRVKYMIQDPQKFYFGGRREGVLTQTEGHDRLVEDDGDEDGEEGGALLLKPDSQTLRWHTQAQG